MHPTEHRRLSGTEAARYLGISASTLSKLRVFGGGPKFHKLGRRVVYDTRDLDGWFEAHQRSSTSDSGEAGRSARGKCRACDAVAGERETAARR
jgi:predicted DNA-binding transcriptional regulator AlpA